MVSRFTRKFNPEEPRDHEAEQYDTHQPPPKAPIPRAPKGSALVLPGGRPHSLYHQLRDCEALKTDIDLAGRCGQDTRTLVVNLDTLRAQDDRVACPRCLPDEADYSKIKNCSVETGTRLRQGLLLLSRQDERARSYSIVMYTLHPRLITEIRTTEELR